MPRKKIKLEAVEYELAHAIVVKGKKAKRGALNPYRRFSTRWYCWITGHKNPGWSAADTLSQLTLLGYPIEVR